MIIESVSTSYFAGISKKNISFEDGLNVVYGDNEDGKSTLVRLISSTLFKPTALNKKSDDDFIATAFPAMKGDGSSPGDVIDGSLVLKTAAGRLTLTKRWNKATNKRASSELDTGAGLIDDDNRIAEALRPLLGCDAGTYGEMLLSPQSAAERNLANLLRKGSSRSEKKEEKSLTKAFLASALAEAIAGSDDIERLEMGINERLRELIGSFNGWDLENDRPVSGYRARVKGLGEVVEALKRKESAAAMVSDLQTLESALNNALSVLSEREDSLNSAQAALSEFMPFSEKLRALENNKRVERSCADSLRRFNEALEAYPGNREAYESARALASERESRAVLDCYKVAKARLDELTRLGEALSKLSRPDDSELAELRSSERRLGELRGKLGGMNLAARLKMLGGSSAKITSLLTGKELEIGDEPAPINEAVRIEIPGIMEMELTPAKANLWEINDELSAIEARRAELFGKYGASSIDELEKLAEEFDGLSGQKRLAEAAFEAAIGGFSGSFAELEASAAALTARTTIRAAVDIERDIRGLCGGVELGRFLGAKEAAVKAFEDEYPSADALRGRIRDCEQELEKARSAVREAENIPEKFRAISDADGYIKALGEAVEAARGAWESALTAKAAAQTNYDRFIELHSAEELRERLERAESEFNSKHELLLSWARIRDVFVRCRSSLSAKSSPELVTSFLANLDAISGGRITAEFPGGKPDFEVVSRGNRLGFSLLSDGSREAVSLAFKLALLEHLFPDGGGVVVLDDPMNDMDENRLDRSCELIGKAAQKHQVILLTCHRAYAAKLGAAAIEIK